MCTDGGDAFFLVGLNNGTIRQYYIPSVKVGPTYIGDLPTSHTTAVQDITFSAKCSRMVSTAQNMIYWQYIGSGYVATQTISDFNPLTVNIAPTEIAVADEGTGKYRVYSFSLNCSNISDATPLNATACSCKAGLIWNGEFCFGEECAQVSNATTNVNATHCNCAPNFNWNLTLRNCAIDCAALNNTIGTRDSKNCYCNTNYTWFNWSCVPNLNCSADLHSYGT